ncbi:MAG: phenylacetate--CoA ligase family protein [Thermosulfidibacteraceae bacterium]
MYQQRLETMDRESLYLLQLKRLKDTIRHIKDNNKFYWNKIGMPEPEDIESLDDLKRLPFLTKDDLREGYPFKYTCAPRESFVRFHMSSGTTGTPIVNFYTVSDVEQWSEIMARCLSCAGVTSRDVVQITPSFGLFNGGFGFHYGCERIGCMVVPIGAGRSMLQLELMKTMGTTVICAIASYPLRLIEVAKEEGFDFMKDTKLRIGIFGAEVWSDEVRKRIENIMGIDTYDIIGMTETGGVGLGIDCKFKCGIHVWEDHYIVEIVDPNTGEVLPDGEEGEMVVTTLTREGLPLIRYRTRDITRIVSRERCECGRTHLRVDRIKGRTDDMLKVKGVNFYPSQIESILMRHKEVGNEYQIVIDEVKGKTKVKIILEVKDFSRVANGELKEHLMTHLYDFLGFRMDLELVPEGTLPRRPGKAQRVVDLRKEKKDSGG